MNLHQLLNAALENADKLEAFAASEKRALTAEELASYQGFVTEAEDLKVQIDAKAKMDAFKKANPRKAAENPTQIVTAVSEPEFTKDANFGFKDSSDFFGAIAEQSKNAGGVITDDRLKYLGAVGSDEQQVQSNPDGGFLVPKSVAAGLLTTSPESDPTIGRVTNIPMATSLVEFNARVDKSHATSVSGGLTVSRTPETVAAATSKMQFEQISLKANELVGVTHVQKD